MSNQSGSSDRPLKRSEGSFARFIPAILGVLLVIGTVTVFRACGPKDDGTWMHCHQAQVASTIFGFVLAVIMLVQALVSSRAVRILLDIVALAGCVVLFLIPGTLISMCMMDTMRCQAVLKPFVRIMAALIGICAAVALFGGVKKKSP